MKIAPRTDFSASMLCGGVRAAGAGFELTTSNIGSAILLFCTDARAGNDSRLWIKQKRAPP